MSVFRVCILLCIFFSPVALAGPKGPSPEEELGILAHRDLSVVQKPLFPTSRRLELSALGLTFPYDPYLVAFHGSVSATYFLSETLGAELFFSYGTGYATYEAKRLQALDVQVDSYLPKSVSSLNLLWTPVYAKLNFLGKHVVHFDVSLVAGGGAFFARRTLYGDVVASSTARRYAFPASLDYGISSRFFMRRGAQMTCARLELRDYLYLLPTSEVGLVLKHNVALGVGVGWFLPQSSRKGDS